MTGAPTESTSDTATSSKYRADSTFQRIAFRFVTVFLLLLITTWEVIRGLNPDTVRLRESLRKSREYEDEQRAGKAALINERDQLKWRLEAFKEYTDFEASVRSLRENHEMPPGRLGFPMGTYLRIEGRRAPKPQRPAKAFGNALIVDRVNGKYLEKPIGVNLREFDLAKVLADHFVLNGYESGEPVGMPDGIPEYDGKQRPQVAWHFHKYFVVTSIVEPKDLAVEQR